MVVTENLAVVSVCMMRVQLEKTSNEQLRAMLVIDNISEVMCVGILRLFGHVEWIEKESWMKIIMCMNVVGNIYSSFLIRIKI